eukprot:8524381-Lingulodinium_polyedra.AAC.1
MTGSVAAQQQQSLPDAVAPPANDPLEQRDPWAACSSEASVNGACPPPGAAPVLSANGGELARE